MPKILIAECKQEVTSLNPVPSHYDDFSVSFGEAIVARHRGSRSEVAGALSVFESHASVQVVPAYSARAITSGGTLGAADFDRIAGEFLSSVRAAPKVDAAHFALHGAMVAQNEDDPEGFLLAEVRKILGEEIPILHAPGATSANLKSLGHTRCARPMFPLDDTVEFSPRPKLFRRR